MGLETNFLEVDLQRLSKLKLHTLFKSPIPHLGIYPNIKMSICENMCVWECFVVFPYGSKRWKTTKVQ